MLRSKNVIWAFGGISHIQKLMFRDCISFSLKPVLEFNLYLGCDKVLFLALI